MPADPYSTDVLEKLLHERLEPVLSSRRTVTEPADRLAGLSRAHQDFAVRWAGVIARSNAELGYQFVMLAPRAFEQMELGEAEAWVINGMDTYDGQGLYPAVEALRSINTFRAAEHDRRIMARYEDVSGVLTHYVRGLSGRGLRLEASEEHYTDTDTLYLPEAVNALGDAGENFSLFKAMVAHMWAQTWYGTFRPSRGSEPSLFELGREYDDEARAMELFSALESVRLDACIERDLPGLGREMKTLREQTQNGEWPAAWQDWIQRLQAPEANVSTTCKALAELYDRKEDAPPTPLYTSAIRPGDAREMIDERQEEEKQELQDQLRDIAEEQGLDFDGAGEDDQMGGFSIEQTADPTDPDGMKLELKFGDEPIELPPDLRALIESILQDLGEVPEDYLQAEASEGDAEGEGEGEPPELEDPEPAAQEWTYDEWDYRRQHYRKQWCTLREIEMPPGEEGFVERTLEKYAGTVAQLRKTFEAIRGDQRTQRRQPDGDDIDFDAIVDAFVDRSRGHEMSDRVFTRLHKWERDMAVVFMVDVSGSTKGWINDAERESLVLLCEALETLGDRYAIYGFSGTTRKRCELFTIKKMDSPYNDTVRQRITAMRPRDYTRMGVTIRHLTQLLMDTDARTRLLVTLSDGKPDDYDGYGGQYGIEDTRKALIEAKHAGVHPYCITIDSEAHDYLPHMYGDVNFAFVRDVRQLPVKVSDIYRRLTT